jgi:hypothetical protein
MATEARQEDDRMQELKIRRQIDSSVSTEVELAQSLGHVEKEPEEHDVDVSGGILAPPEAVSDED